MAVWQFEVVLEPSGLNGSHPEPEASHRFIRDDADILQKVDGILPRSDSWSDDLILWGEEGGH